MNKKLNPTQLAGDIFDLFLKETESNKQFRDALRNFIVAIEHKENKWMEKNLEHLGH